VGTNKYIEQILYCKQLFQNKFKKNTQTRNRRRYADTPERTVGVSQRIYRDSVPGLVGSVNGSRRECRSM
jgi:hypothetical protein